MKHALILTLCLALAACGGNPRSSQPDASNPAPKVQVAAPNFSDNDPHPWAGQDPAKHPVHGVDVSRFQTAVDWEQARANGVSFAFIKATEGGDMVDPMFKTHWRGAASAGVKRGAYHFYYHCRAPEEQARWFFKHVPRSAGSLPPVLDMEWTPTSPTCTIRREADVIRRDAAVIVAMMTEHYGTRPVLYTTVDFFEDNQMWRLSGVDFWLRSVAAHPSDRYPGQHWAFWQYTSTGLVPGCVARSTSTCSRGAKTPGPIGWARGRCNSKGRPTDFRGAAQFPSKENCEKIFQRFFWSDPYGSASV